MPLLAVGAGVGLLGAGMQFFGGRSQEKAGKKALANLKMPSTEIPQELLDQLSDAEKRQVMGLRPEQKAEFVKNMQRSKQEQLKRTSDLKGGLLGLQQSTSQEQDAFNNLISMDAAAYEQNRAAKEAAVNAARQNVAGWKQRQQDIAMQNYQQQVDAANAQIGAGQQNKFGAFGTLANTALGIGSAMYKPGGGGGG